MISYKLIAFTEVEIKDFKDPLLIISAPKEDHDNIIRTIKDSFPASGKKLISDNNDHELPLTYLNMARYHLSNSFEACICALMIEVFFAISTIYTQKEPAPENATLTKLNDDTEFQRMMFYFFLFVVQIGFIFLVKKTAPQYKIKKDDDLHTIFGNDIDDGLNKTSSTIISGLTSITPTALDKLHEISIMKPTGHTIKVIMVTEEGTLEKIRGFDRLFPKAKLIESKSGKFYQAIAPNFDCAHRIIENLKLNSLFNYVREVIPEKNHTLFKLDDYYHKLQSESDKTIIILTGKTGTGKTSLIKQYSRERASIVMIKRISKLDAEADLYCLSKIIFDYILSFITQLPILVGTFLVLYKSSNQKPTEQSSEQLQLIADTNESLKKYNMFLCVLAAILLEFIWNQYLNYIPKVIKRFQFIHPKDIKSIAVNTLPPQHAPSWIKDLSAQFNSAIVMIENFDDFNSKELEKLMNKIKSYKSKTQRNVQLICSSNNADVCRELIRPYKQDSTLINIPRIYTTSEIKPVEPVDEVELLKMLKTWLIQEGINVSNYVIINGIIKIITNFSTNNQTITRLYLNRQLLKVFQRFKKENHIENDESKQVKLFIDCFIRECLHNDELSQSLIELHTISEQTKQILPKLNRTNLRRYSSFDETNKTSSHTSLVID